VSPRPGGGALPIGESAFAANGRRDENVVQHPTVAAMPARLAKADLEAALAKADLEAAVPERVALIDPHTVEAAHNAWLAYPFVMANTLNLIQGHGGVIKGTWCCHLGAQASRGEIAGERMMVLGKRAASAGLARAPARETSS
jgi:hypothetical protein